MMRWLASHHEVRRIIVAIVFWIGVLALMARPHQTRKQTALLIAVWALLVIAGVLLLKQLD